MKDNFFFCGKVGHYGAADVEAIDKNKKKNLKQQNKTKHFNHKFK